MRHQMDYKKSHAVLRLLATGGGVLAFVGLWLGMNSPFLNVLAGLGAAAILVGWVQALVFYKCPQCGRHFDLRGKRPDYCPGCARKLDW